MMFIYYWIDWSKVQFFLIASSDEQVDQVQDQLAAPAGSEAIEFTYFSNKVLTTPAVRRIAMENNVS